jgi:UDP-N-acetylglucosamine--N-acetylmuramyl-(pentapeptide) pyrophosphoryl-undecaprenol N-acetylglucosamine transferase
MKNNKYKFLFAGGGTGGHLFPAIAVAEKIKELKPEAEILFVGTRKKIEARVVPQLGYEFKSIWIKGFARKINIENILFPLKLIVSMIQSLVISIRFKPKVAIGSGGYVSGPAVWGASVLGAHVMLLEQNSFPGVTTRILEKRADRIHLSYEDSKQYLSNKEKAVITGNPVRGSLKLIDRNTAAQKFGLMSSKKTILILGGSLGAASINKAVAESVVRFCEKDIQVIWQTGNLYYENYCHLKSGLIWVNPFIEDMSAAYSACDFVIARSGATTIAELAMLGIPAIFIPSPNVAANHQYKNAKSLSDKDAAVLLEDDKSENELFNEAMKLAENQERVHTLSENIKLFGKADAALVIAREAIAMAEK